jgi:hypothetical protein
MLPSLGRFCKDERGSLLVSEWMFVATILVLALMSTTLTVRHHVHHDCVQASADWHEGN